MPGDILMAWLRAICIGTGLSRCFVLPLLGALSTAAGALTIELTESAAIKRALSRESYQQLEQGRLAVAESAVLEAALLPNPVSSFEREGLSSSGGQTAETSIHLSQTFAISGRRGIKRAAAEQRLDATRAEQLDHRLATVAEARRAFADVLHREHAKIALSSWHQRIEAAHQTVRQLSAAGDVSGYDRRRVAREVQAANVRLASAEADLGRAREVLAGLTDIDLGAELKVVGVLLPDEPQPLESLQSMLRERPDLEALRSQAAAFERDRLAAERVWIPDLTVGLGTKHVEERDQSDDRLLLSLSVPLPVFDRGQVQRAKAIGQVQSLHAERALLLKRLEANLRGVWRQATELRRTAEEFRRDSLSGSRELSQIAESAYRSGEGGILELLDAYRAEQDAELLGLDLEARARLARIELDLLSGTSIYE